MNYGQEGVFTDQISGIMTLSGGWIPPRDDKETLVRQDDDGLGLFSGGHRAELYDDPATTDHAQEQSGPTRGTDDAALIRGESTADARPSETGWDGPPPPPTLGTPPEPQPEPPRDLVLATQATAPAETPGLWQRFMIRVGAAPAPPTAAEVQDRENERIVRQSTWTRAMSVTVANRKGGSAKTPVTVLLAGAIADIRGGGVAAWEAADVAGDLSVVAEGTPPRGMTELLAGRTTITSAGTLAGYTAPQTSHAAVIGSVSDRNELTPEDVTSTRELLGTYYQIDVADTANNLKRPSLQTLLQGTDAVVIPCVVNDLSIYALEETLTAVSRSPGLRARTVLVVSHDGGPENPAVSRNLMENLRRFHSNVKGIVELPFDPAIRADGELSYDALQPATRLAMREIAKHVIEAFNDATNTTGSE